MGAIGYIHAGFASRVSSHDSGDALFGAPAPNSSSSKACIGSRRLSTSPRHTVSNGAMNEIARSTMVSSSQAVAAKS
jgi:hypothetical protein